MITLQTLRDIAYLSANEEFGLTERPRREDVDSVLKAFAERVELPLAKAVKEGKSVDDPVEIYNLGLIDFLSETFPALVSAYVKQKASSIEDVETGVDAWHKRLTHLKGAVLRESGEVELIPVEKCPVKFHRQDIKAVYAVKNPAMDKKYRAYVRKQAASNAADKGRVVKTLCHCSSNNNWASIIEDGLLVRPTGIQVHGKSLGEGVYFTETPDTMRTNFLSQTGSFTETEYVNSRFFGIYEGCLSDENHTQRNDEICIFDEDAFHLTYLVELWAI